MHDYCTRDNSVTPHEAPNGQVVHCPDCPWFVDEAEAVALDLAGVEPCWLDERHPAPEWQVPPWRFRNPARNLWREFARLDFIGTIPVVVLACRVDDSDIGAVEIDGVLVIDDGWYDGRGFLPTHFHTPWVQRELRRIIRRVLRRAA